MAAETDESIPAGLAEKMHALEICGKSSSAEFRGGAVLCEFDDSTDKLLLHSAKKSRRKQKLQFFGDGDGSFFDGWVAGTRQLGLSDKGGHRAPMLGTKHSRDMELVHHMKKTLPRDINRLESYSACRMHDLSRHVNSSLPPTLAWPNALSTAARALSGPPEIAAQDRPKSAQYHRVRERRNQWAASDGENRTFVENPSQASTFRPYSANASTQGTTDAFTENNRPIIARSRHGLFRSFAAWEAHSTLEAARRKLDAHGLKRPSTSIEQGRGIIPKLTQAATLGGCIHGYEKIQEGSLLDPQQQLQAHSQMSWSKLVRRVEDLLPEQTQDLLYSIQADKSSLCRSDQDFQSRFRGVKAAADASAWSPPELPIIQQVSGRPESAAGRFSMASLARVPRASAKSAASAASTAQRRAQRLQLISNEFESVGQNSAVVAQVEASKSTPLKTKPHRQISSQPTKRGPKYSCKNMYELGLPASLAMVDHPTSRARLANLTRQDIASNIAASRNAPPEKLVERIDANGVMDLSFFGLGHGDCEMLAAALTGSGQAVHAINLADNGLSGRAFTALLVALVTQKDLHTLNISGNILLAAQMQVLNRVLTALSKLASIQLSNCGVKGTLHTSLVQGCLSAPLLQELNLSNNQVSPSAAIELAALIANHAELRVVKLDWCGMNEVGTTLIAAACISNEIKGGKLQVVSLEANRISEETGQRLGADLRKNNQLKLLNLAETGLGPRSAQVFASTMQAKNFSLACVDLSRNRFGPVGTRALLRSAIRTSTVQLDERSTNPHIIELARRRNVPLTVHTGVDTSIVREHVAPRFILVEIGMLTPLDGAFDPMFPEATNQGLYRLDCSDAWEQAVFEDILMGLKYQPGFIIESVQASSGGQKQSLNFDIAVQSSTELTQRLKSAEREHSRLLTEATSDRQAAGKLMGFMRKAAKDDMALRQAGAMTQWRSQKNLAIQNFNATTERLKREASYIIANQSRFEVPDFGVFTIKIVRKPQQPSIGLGASDIQAAVMLSYLQMQSISTAGRVGLLRLISTDHWFDVRHAVLLVNRVAEAEETKYSGQLLALRAECILTLITQLVDPRERDNLFSKTLSDSNIKSFYQGAGALSRFQMANCTGHYVLNLTNEPDRKLLLLLLQVNGADALQRNKLGLVDPSQKGTSNNFRNTLLNGRKVNLLRYIARHGDLPSGILNTDFVCTRRPEPDDSQADNLEVLALLNELSTIFGDGHDGGSHIEQFKAIAWACGDKRKEMSPVQVQVSSPRAKQRTKKRLFKAVSFSIGKMAAALEKSRKKRAAEAAAAGGSSEEPDDFHILEDQEGIAAAVLAIRPQIPPEPDPHEAKFEADWGSSAARRAQAKTLEQRWTEWRKREPDPFSDLDRGMQQKFNNRLEIALDHLRVASTEVFYTEVQALAIVKCFPEVPYLARAQAVVVIFSRLWTVSTAWKLMGLLSSSWAKHFVAERLGYLNIFDPTLPKHSFELELQNIDEHRTAQLIVELFSAEQGTKFVDSSHNDLPGWQLPMSWLQSVPQEGHWCCTVNSATDESGINQAVRKKLKAQTLLHADSLVQS